MGLKLLRKKGPDKNLLDDSFISDVYLEDHNYIVKGYFSSTATLVDYVLNDAYRTAKINLGPGTYTWWTDTPNCRLLRYAINGEITTDTRNVNNLTFTLTEDSEFQIAWRKSDSTTIVGEHTMIVRGSVAPTVYEPYQEYIYKGGVYKRLVPNEYNTVEYIESNGTQYIDTGLKSTSEKIIYDFTCVDGNNISASSVLFGSELTSDDKKYSGLLYSNGSGNKRTLYAGTSVNLDVNYTLSIDKAHNVLTLNDGVATLVRNNTQLGQANYVGSLQNDANIYLFCNNGSSAKQKSSYKLYEWKMYDNEVLVGHFIPVRKKSNNEYGMYDVVNQQFHGNSGTGSFAGGSVMPSYEYKMLNKEETL